MRRRYLYLLCLFLGIQGLFAQKEYRHIKGNLKAGRATEALSEIAKLVGDSCRSGDSRLYAMGVEAYLRLNATQNEKAYLKQQMDTSVFFSSTFGICDYVLRMDSVDQEQNRLKKKLKYRVRNAGLITRYYPNLEAAVTYYYRHKKYAEVEKFSALCLKVAGSELWKSIPETPEVRRCRLAMRYAQSSYLQNKYEQVIAAQEEALKDSLHRRLILEYVALSYKELNDKENYESTLREAITEFPNYLPFFSYMLEKLLDEGRNEGALALCDTLISRIGSDKELLYGKCLSLLALGRWKSLITTSEEILILDREEKMANYFIGLSYCNLAVAVHLPISITSSTYKEAQTRQRQYYRQALSSLERYRELCPDDQTRWAPLLYQVYLSLNMGSKFEEIQKLL